MPKDDLNYKFTENGLVYDFYDVFVPAENFRQPTLFTWGRGNEGQLGTNDTTSRKTPVTTFAGGTDWKSVSCGRKHTLAIKTDGSLWGWGNNQFGMLGINDTTNRSTPVTTFAGGTNWKSVACGGYYVTAIKTDGTLWVWGVGGRQLGINNNDSKSTPVTTFAGGTNWKSVACGGQHTAAIKTDGTLWIWGRGNEGQLGTGNGDSKNVPVTTFAGGTTWKSVVCGGYHTAAIKTDGTLWTWGKNSDFGQLGINDITNRNTPITTFAGGTNWKQVSTQEGNHTTAIKTDGSLWVWGAGTNGQLGTNDAITRSTPVTTFAGGNNWKQVFGAGSRTVAIKSGLNVDLS